MNQDTLFFRVSRAVVLGAAVLLRALSPVIAFATSSTPFEALSTSFSWIPARPTLRRTSTSGTRCRSGGTSSTALIVTTGTVAIVDPDRAGRGLCRHPLPVPRPGGLHGRDLSTQMFPGIFFLIPLFLIFVKVQTPCWAPDRRDAARADRRLSLLCPAALHLGAGGLLRRDLAGHRRGRHDRRAAAALALRPARAAVATWARSSRSRCLPRCCRGARCCSRRC